MSVVFPLTKVNQVLISSHRFTTPLDTNGNFRFSRIRRFSKKPLVLLTVENNQYVILQHHANLVKVMGGKQFLLFIANQVRK